MFQKLIVAIAICTLIRPLINDNITYLAVCIALSFPVGVLLAKIKK